MVQKNAITISLEEFLQRPETKPASEYINGQIVPNPVLQGHHSTIQVELTAAIHTVLKKPRIARAYTELRCVLGGWAIVPDISVFQGERIPVGSNGEVGNVFPIAPDWTIEIFSPPSKSEK
ncbi:Uma2 family endonuclease [Geitlerinema sp. PCC 9228]|jgi:Uma2 family endonuclease|uniref:Uma2 family endonuclease n=1 Tax=Geitlerinema sp. PCC 9228 TaxID=111611 RepID=UPI000B1CB2B7|nr:Uma2 family endonuclease [Geitlerinema sp. PCC 9228]